MTSDGNAPPSTGSFDTAGNGACHRTPHPTNKQTSPWDRQVNPGRWELERERYQLPEDAVPVPQTREVCVSDIIPDLVARLGLEGRLWEQTLLQEWPSLVGPAIARRARPGGLQRRTLIVYVSNSAWLHELERFAKEELLQRLQSRFGADRIRSIRFAPDPDLARPTKT